MSCPLRIELSEEFLKEDLLPLEGVCSQEQPLELLVPIDGNLDDLFPQESQLVEEEVCFSKKRREVKKTDLKTRKSRWSPEEDLLIVELFAKNGGNWKLIASHLKQRPPDCVKNRFYGTIKKKLTPEQRDMIKRGRFGHGPTTEEKTQSFQHCTEEVLLRNFLAGENAETSLENGSLVESILFEPPKTANPEQRRNKVQDLYNKMAAIEAFITKTRRDINHLKTLDN